MWPGLFYTHLVLPWYGENPLKCPFMILESWLDLQLHFKKQTKKQYGRRDRILFCEIRLEKHLLPPWTPSLVLSFAHEKATFSLERLMWQETEGNLPPATSTKQTSVQQRVRSWETLRTINPMSELGSRCLFSQVFPWDCRPSRHLHCNFRRDLETQLPS